MLQIESNLWNRPMIWNDMKNCNDFNILIWIAQAIADLEKVFYVSRILNPAVPQFHFLQFMQYIEYMHMIDQNVAKFCPSRLALAGLRLVLVLTSPPTHPPPTPTPTPKK